MFEAIPNALRQYRSWVVWRIVTTETGRPTKVPYDPRTRQPASSTDPNTWVSYDEAVYAHGQGGWDGIGFVLSDADPFTFVDLDDPYATNPDGTPKHKEPALLAKLQNEVFQRFEGTYAELSPSGKGLHIISLGISPSGRRRHAVEMYSRERFMTMTGNAFANNPIVDKQATIKWLYDEMGGAPQIQTFTGDFVDAETDDVVIAKVLNAANGDKVRDLVSGNWQLHYGSQSEADFALIDIIAYYTKSRFQIARLFRQSALGNRDKASRDNYVMPMIDRAFDRQPAQLDIDAMRNAIEAEFQRNVGGVGSGSTTFKASAPMEGQPAHAPSEAVTTPSPQELAPRDQTGNPYLRPVPGLLGQIAYYIYDQAPRPVPEIALAGAIGLMAGIVGRAYNVSGTGLNSYVLLLAGTGRGKEAISSGVNKLMAKVVDINHGGCPAALEFHGPGDIASGQALVRHMGKVSRSFVSIVGEVDSMIKNMTARNANAGLVKLRSVLLDIYNKSGQHNVLQGTIYSDIDKNAGSITSPAFSMIGEGTPQRFYQMLDEAMVTDGLLPRFMIIEYDGPRVDSNEARMGVQPSTALVKAVAALCGQALLLNQQNRPIEVGYTPEAKAMFNSFDKTTTGLINGAHNHLIEELWNRAHLKALKLASLIAVGCNHQKPVIDKDMAEYAIDCVRWDISRLVFKFQSGDIGDGLSKQLADMRKAIIQMMNLNEKRAKALGMTFEMCRDKLISRRGLMQSLTGIASYKNAREGAGRAFDAVIRELELQGVLKVIGPIDMQSRYGSSGKYYILNDVSWLEL